MLQRERIVISISMAWGGFRRRQWVPSSGLNKSIRAQKIPRKVRTPTGSDGSNLDGASNRAADQVRRMWRRRRVRRMCSRGNGIGPPLRRRRTDATSTGGLTSSRQPPIRRTRFGQPPVRPTWRQSPVWPRLILSWTDRRLRAVDGASDPRSGLGWMDQRSEWRSDPLDALRLRSGDS